MDKQRIVLGNTATQAAENFMSVDIIRPARQNPAKIAFVFHGRNGNSDSPHLMKMIEPYLAKDYLVVSPNLCNSEWNDSAGTGKDFLIAEHVRDCARTIEWAKASRGLLGWEEDNFALCGHSMGGFAASFLAATTYNDRTRHVLAVAPFTSGERLIDAREKYHPNGLMALHAECPHALNEWPGHCIFNVAKNLHMPVSAVVGVNDNLTLPSDIADFFKAVPNGVDLLVLNNEHHCLIGDDVPAILGGCIARLEEAATPRPTPYAAPGFSP